MKKFLVLGLVALSFFTLTAYSKAFSASGKKGSGPYQYAFDYCNDNGWHLGTESDYKNFGIGEGIYWVQNGCRFNAREQKVSCLNKGQYSSTFYCF